MSTENLNILQFEKTVDKLIAAAMIVFDETDKIQNVSSPMYINFVFNSNQDDEGEAIYIPEYDKN